MDRTLLFALSQRDREGFFPGSHPEAEFGPRARWLDTSALRQDEWARLLGEDPPTVLVTGWETPRLPESVAANGGRLPGYICHLAGGVGGLVPRSYLEKGVVVSNWGTAISHTIAEHAMLLTLGALRNLPLWADFMHMPPTRTRDLQTKSLRGRRVGLHGFGAIARELVEMLRPYQVKLSAFSHGVPEEVFHRQGVKPCESLEKLFSQSDILIEVEVLSTTTRGSITGALLDLLPQDAIFVNVGRGAVVDEPALTKRAVQGRIRLATDVYVHEPPPRDSAFFQIPNALLSPHIGGPASDALPLCGEFALANLHRYLRGEAVEGKVTLEIYDRST